MFVSRYRLRAGRGPLGIDLREVGDVDGKVKRLVGNGVADNVLYGSRYVSV